MKLKFFLIFAVFGLNSFLWAASCPTIQDIKKNHLSNWKAYDSDDNTPLSPERLHRFKQLAYQFALAEWNHKSSPNNRIHCYYHDANGSELGVYLEKSNFVPENSQGVWYQVTGLMHCAASINQCLFQPKTLTSPLAKNHS